MKNIGNRRQGRELALKAIYAFELQDLPDMDAHLRAFWGNFCFDQGPLGDPVDGEGTLPPAEVRDFTELLVRGVAQRLPQIDQLLTEHATNWSLERMARVDLALLRLATFELLFQSETPRRVIINEAIEVGKRFGTRETPGFINGILDKLARSCRGAAE